MNQLYTTITSMKSTKTFFLSNLKENLLIEKPSKINLLLFTIELIIQNITMVR